MTMTSEEWVERLEWAVFSLLEPEAQLPGAPLGSRYDLIADCYSRAQAAESARCVRLRELSEELRFLRSGLRDADTLLEAELGLVRKPAKD